MLYIEIENCIEQLYRNKLNILELWLNTIFFLEF
jgi:hypothetical protein